MSDAALALCRVCLASDINMYYIANTQYQEIFEKLSTQLCTVDRRPETVCYICFSLLKRCCRFMNMSRKAEAVLTQISLSGMQTTPENVADLKLTMPTLSVALTQHFFSGDKYDSSHLTGNQQVIFVEEGATTEETEANNFVPSDIVYVKIEVESDHDNFDESAMDMEPPNLQTSNEVEDKKMLHTLQEPYSCSRCNKIFNKKSGLTRHMRVRTGEKIFTCDLSNKEFNHKSNSTRRKSYACDICEKQFHKKSNLTRHMRVHTGENPYVCDICDKQFNQNGDLTRHMRVHTGEKPYDCDLCDKKFNQRSNLTKHMKVHAARSQMC